MTAAEHPVPDDAPGAHLFSMITGHHVSAAVHTMAGLGLADALGDASLGVDELAERTSCDAGSLRRLLHMLVAVGLVREDGDGRVSLTPCGDLLRAGHPESMRAVALLHAGPGHTARWSSLADRVRQGPEPEGPYDAEGANPFAAMPPHVAEIFREAMGYFAREAGRALLEAYDFRDAGRVVDVGGGAGALLVTLLENHPDLRGTLVDLPAIAEAAQERITREALGDRCTVVPGDFFAEVPPGGDVYLLKDVLHDWSDERCHRLLANCRAAIPPTGRLLLVETVRPERPGTAWRDRLASASDVLMMLGGGQERTESEFRALLGANGFDLVSVRPMVPAWSGTASTHVVEAVPAA